ncbi:L-lactate permease [Solirubrobacter ginsenosidimutans]|uniref:L-lactate permease n=1 Tax=Solirubrobacter ginsenosidimutans TaxID=490573 RepID=A0A9X3MWS0_9ACTN|nr:L-lactate permease [Solirubrobacter ginsenosidimutans]MDA0164134.1 L-lactate permease [Solirubrobacter ginsenosidimutans]
MYKQVLDPVGDSLFLSALVAMIPLATLFLLLGGLKLKSHWAGLLALLAAILVAVIAYSMPVGQALDAAVEGAAFGLFPIMWIVWNAIWIFNMTEDSGHFAVLRRSFAAISDDQRIQAVIIAFSFGALLEALAGFGTPVAITSIMLLGLGFKPMKAASVALVANTAPVAFGAIAIPIVTLAGLTEIPKEDLGAMVGRQTPLLALFVPLILVGMVDGWRGIRAVWPAALTGGVSFAIGQFVCSNYLSVELTDIVASLLSVAAMVAFLRVWQPGTPLVAESVLRRGGPLIAGAATADATHEAAIRRREGDGKDSRADVIGAYAPYVIIIIVFGLAQWGPIKDLVAKGTAEFSWPGLNILNAKGEAPSAVTYKLNWAPAAGSLLLLCGLLTMAYLRIAPRAAAHAYGRMVNQLKWATVTVAAVLALAYVMNLSAQTLTIGTWIAGAGGIFALLSPIIGWLGTAVTGSDTSSNSLFGVLQVSAAKEAGLDQTLMAAANSSGGVLGKMVSPQNLAIGAAAVGLGGQEGEVFRKVIGWSLLLLAIMCVLVYLQSTAVLSWMVV